MGKSKITLTEEELVASFQSWWNSYEEDKAGSVDYDAVDYDDTNYARDSAATFMKHLVKVQGE